MKESSAVSVALDVYQDSTDVAVVDRGVTCSTSPQTCCSFAGCDQCASCEDQRIPDLDPGA